MITALVVLYLLCVPVFIAIVVWTAIHAAKHGYERQLEYFTLGECVPPATREEVERWTRDV